MLHKRLRMRVCVCVFKLTKSSLNLKLMYTLFNDSVLLSRLVNERIQKNDTRNHVPYYVTITASFRVFSEIMEKKTQLNQMVNLVKSN